MAKLVVNGAQLECSQGLAPSSLTVLPAVGSSEDQKPVATVNDHVPMLNVAPFGMCQSMANPQVAAATAAAMGTLTPQPCVPVIPAPWSPGSSLMTFNGVAALITGSTCTCTWNGTVEITDPAATVESD